MSPYSTSNQIDLQFQLFGSSVSNVPEPSRIWLMISGLGFLASKTLRKIKVKGANTVAKLNGLPV
jgi:hypothetical protein